MTGISGCRPGKTKENILKEEKAKSQVRRKQRENRLQEITAKRVQTYKLLSRPECRWVAGWMSAGCSQPQGPRWASRVFQAQKHCPGPGASTTKQKHEHTVKVLASLLLVGGHGHVLRWLSFILRKKWFNFSNLDKICPCNYVLLWNYTTFIHK